MFFEYIKNFTLFLFIFVSFNDTVSIEYIGDFIVKGAFLLFLITHIKDLYYTFFLEKTRLFYTFFIFILTLSIVTIITYFFKQDAIYMSDMIKLFSIRVLAFIVIFLYVTYTDKLKMVLYMIWFSMVVSSIIAAFSPPVEEWTFRRVGGTEDPNDFAAQLLGVIFITYYLFKENRNWIFLILSLPLFFYTLLYAGSKSSFIFLALISILIFIVRFRDIIDSIFTLKGLLASMLILSLVAGGIYLMSGSSAVKGLEHRSSKMGTLQQRFIVWRAGSEMIRDNFFLGVGFAQFPNVSKNYLKDWLPDEALPSHNNFIKIFAEGGIFSFLTFLFFIISLFSTKVREIFGSNYFWIYVASLSVVLMGLTIPSLHHKDYWIMLSLISAVIYRLTYNIDEDELSEDRVT